jgi:poly(hydroxyalkanoate) granule-associated protein
MAKKNGTAPKVEVVVEEQSSNVVVDSAHKVLLVGLGAVGMSQDTLKNVQEEFENFFNKLVERGETVEKDGRKFVNEAFEHRKKQTEDLTDKAESELDKRIEDVLNRMNIPTKADINELMTRINALSRKVDDLKKTPA